ncbi:MAG TPA: xanthine dehydrogenase family protein molybdopterin-binding subunit [Phycisphaerales bacterium]|nr:xanthine dehydrogenase family protein molybdopterin-binding subunit [Phycisphaerales bacterium]
MKRIEGLAKLTGAERYVDDGPADAGLGMGPCLWGMTVRSPPPHARGRVKEIRYGKGGGGIDWSKLVVVDHRDIPGLAGGRGVNEVLMIGTDQPVLAAEYVRHVHEAVVLIAGEDREMVRRAVAAVEVVVEGEEAALDYRVEPTAAQVQGGFDANVLKRLGINKGDVEAALAAAPIVVEGEYETGAQEHVYIECNGMIGWVDAAGVVCVKGSMQCPYYVLNALKHTFACDEKGVRVIQTATGGGFGGKEDYPSVIGLHVALLAAKAGGGRPVKMIYDRGEDMQATTKRHPCLVRHRTGVDRDGRLLAQDIQVRMDAGAYVTLSPVVLSRGIIHAAGPYFCPNVRVDGKAILTNSVPYGAFRGFGAPQTIFACERHMDVIAARLGMAPEELRRRNLLRDGQTTATGQVIKAHAPSPGTDRVALMDRALVAAGWAKKKQEHTAFNAASDHLRRGMGLATFWHGAGFTGSGETYLKSRVHVAGLPDGRVEVRIATTEMGQGTTTVMTQIAADRLGLAADRVVVAVPDTTVVPNSGPTVASRTVMVVGRLVERACEDLLVRVGLGKDAKGAVVGEAVRRWHHLRNAEGGGPRGELIGEAVYRAPPGVQWDDATYRGDAYGTFGWAAYVAEVEVDLRTYAARVVDFVAVQGGGSVINPTLARGQVAGGVVQAIGWALMEEFAWKDGAMANATLTNYIIPTSDDVPRGGIRVEFVENPYPHGGKGSKGIGELPMDGPGPAIANAVADALKEFGVEPNRLPLTPERVMGMMEKAEAAHA